MLCVVRCVLRCDTILLQMANSGGDLKSKKQWANPEMVTRMIMRTKEILDRYKKQYASDAEFNRHVKIIHADGGPKCHRTSTKGKQGSKGKTGNRVEMARKQVMTYVYLYLQVCMDSICACVRM